ncbi:FkbM family methyltransferase [Candidatus Gottesmanbacteria bacterium]|nr:FkbM family methyltransferase [Candidatus Gottesmanbacteria bacterium]
MHKYRLLTDATRFLFRNKKKPVVIFIRIIQYVKRDVFLRPFISLWVKLSQSLFHLAKFQPISFEPEGVFIHANNNLFYCYDTELEGGLAGMEYGGLWESQELALILENTPINGTVLDIGACFGSFTFPLANEKHAYVHAFEPGKKAFSLLTKNYQKNNLPGITLINSAVGDKMGTVRLSMIDYMGNYIVSKNKLENTDSAPMMTVDLYVRQKKLKSVDSIKCDVEGSEYSVLQGAKKTIETFSPVVLVEIHDELLDRQNASADKIFDFFEIRGYTYRRITEDNEVKTPLADHAAELSQGHNFFFYKSKK